MEGKNVAQPVADRNLPVRVDCPVTTEIGRLSDMKDNFDYSATPTRNPFRYIGAVWRLLTWETTDDLTEEAAIVEIGFARSRIGRRVAQWGKVIAQLKQASPGLEQVFVQMPPVLPFNLDHLHGMDSGTLAQAFANHCRSRDINPNLVNIAIEDEESWFLHHLFMTHDIWHVVTGWPNDERGEVGLGGFYCGQLRSPPFFVFMLSLIWLKSVWHKKDTEMLVSAFTEGYQQGKAAGVLFGIDWTSRWTETLLSVRQDMGLEATEVLFPKAA